MASALKKYFELMNIFSYKIGFNYKRNKFYHSFFGFFLSWVLIMCSGILVFYFSKDMIYKTNPNLVYKESIKSEKDEFKLKDIFKKVELTFYDKYSGLPNLPIDFDKFTNYKIIFKNNKEISYIELKFEDFYNKNTTTQSISLDSNKRIKKCIDNLFIECENLPLSEVNYTASTEIYFHVNIDFAHIDQNHSYIQKAEIKYFLTDFYADVQNETFFVDSLLEKKIDIFYKDHPKIENVVYNYNFINFFDDKDIFIADFIRKDFIKRNSHYKYLNFIEDFKDIRIFEIHFDKILKTYKRS